MRAVLVFDMPDVCDEDKCPLCYDGAICAYTGRRIIEGWGKPNSCPLRPLPKVKTREEEKAKDPLNEDLFYDDFIRGWNDCIDAITGDADADS